MVLNELDPHAAALPTLSDRSEPPGQEDRLAHTHVPEWLTRAALPASAWARIASSPLRLLILDYDGTLVPFRADRMAARPEARDITVLREVTTRSTLRPVILSGRPLDELLELIGEAEAHLIGLHGWEEWSPESGRVEHPLEPAVAGALAQAAEGVRLLGWGEMLEIKRCALAFHTRRLNRAAAIDYERRVGLDWQPLGERPGLRFDTMHGGLELRASARDKGTVIRGLLHDAPEGTIATFVGDDATDEAGFKILRDVGVTIRVGEDHAPTAAAHRLASPAHVWAFVRRWRDLIPAPETRA